MFTPGSLSREFSSTILSSPTQQCITIPLSSEKSLSGLVSCNCNACFTLVFCKSSRKKLQVMFSFMLNLCILFSFFFFFTVLYVIAVQFKICKSSNQPAVITLTNWKYPWTWNKVSEKKNSDLKIVKLRDQKPFSFRCWPQHIICLHLTLPLASSSVTPNLCISSTIHYPSSAHIRVISALPLLLCPQIARPELFLCIFVMPQSPNHLKYVTLHWMEIWKK